MQSYIDGAQLRMLRKTSSDFIFYRDGAKIYAVPLNHTSDRIGQPFTIDVASNHKLASYIINYGVLKVLKAPELRFTNLRPVKFTDLSRNLLNQVSKTRTLYGLGIFPQTEIQTRVIQRNDKKPEFGLVVDISTKFEILASVEELIAQGLDLRGLYVITKEFNRIGDIDTIFHKLIGRINSIDNNEAILDGTVDRQRIGISECFLESSVRNFNRVLSTLVKEDYEDVKQELKKLQYGLLGPEGRLKEIEKIYSKLKQAEPILCSNNFGINVISDRYSEMENGLEFTKLEVPVFIFNTAGDRISDHAARGINRYGPFDSEFFSKKNPKILVITPNKFEPQARDFINTLEKGMPDSLGFSVGLIEKYKLDGMSYEIVPFDIEGYHSLVEAYRDACLHALEVRQDYDLAFVVIQEIFKSFSVKEDPYPTAKSVLMSQGIPVQEIEVETISKNDQWAMNNIALVSYAKMGGVPWTISTQGLPLHELVIGLGSTLMSADRLSATKRYVGITTFFTADGKYLLNNVSREIEYEKYQGSLVESLRLIIREIAVRNGWKENDNIRLIFHQGFKDYKYTEINAIRDLVSQLRYNVEFAFLRIGRETPFNIVDEKQMAINNKGKFVPERGFLFYLNPTQALLTVKGPKQLLTQYEPLPKPLQITLHPASTFQDVSYLSKQVFDFTFLSWRGFNLSSMPVTLVYSGLIARLLTRLRSVQNWNPDLLRTRLRESRWFL